MSEDTGKSKKVPKLRFPGFTDDWEQRRLGEVSDICGGGTPSTSESDFWDGDIDWYTPAEIGESDYVDGSIRKITAEGLEACSAKILPIGTVLFTSRAGIGNTAILQKEGATNQGFQSIIPKEEKLDSYFIYSSCCMIKKYAEKHGAGSTFLEISGKELRKMKIKIPSFKEQQKIGKFFELLDHHITFQQRKLDHLKERKKALLQKMFPKEGTNVPELRFPGFTDAWEQRRLGEVGKSTGGVSLESEFVETGEYKIISIGSYSENGRYIDQGIRINKSKKVLTRILRKNDLAMILNDKTSTGNIIGRVLLIEEDELYVYNQRTERIEVYTDIFCPVFLYEMLNADNIRSKIIKRAQGNTQIYVNWTDISKLIYYIPQSIDEQQKIGQFFELLDYHITVQQRKLDHLKLRKKALLQQMFV